MIKKVLIAEDHESINISVQKTVEELNIAPPDHVYYCDDALAKIQHALKKGEPYDLLITDLYFEKDENKQKIPDGFSLIPAVRQLQPDIKILVFSAEQKPSVIEPLYDDLHIDGYVQKARHDMKELNAAFEMIAKNQCYRPRQLTKVARQIGHNYTDYDKTILSLLAEGMRQNQIPEYLRKNKIRPSSLSSLEKRLNQIKETEGFTNNEQLVLFCKKWGII